MEPKIFHIDSYLSQAGSSVTDFIIIARGEGQVRLDVTQEPTVVRPNTSPTRLMRRSSKSPCQDPAPSACSLSTSAHPGLTRGKSAKFPSVNRSSSGAFSKSRPGSSDSCDMDADTVGMPGVSSSLDNLHNRKQSLSAKYTFKRQGLPPQPVKTNRTETIELGRIGPGAVLGLELAQCENTHTEVWFAHLL